MDTSDLKGKLSGLPGMELSSGSQYTAAMNAVSPDSGNDYSKFRISKPEKIGDLLSGLDLSAILNKRNEIKKPENCMGCGTVLEWKATIMYQQRCPNCGLLIVAYGRIPEQKTECWGCFDTGVIELEVQFDGLIYRDGRVACLCPAGNRYASILTRANESKYAPPFDTIIKRNRELFKK